MTEIILLDLVVLSALFVIPARHKIAIIKNGFLRFVVGFLIGFIAVEALIVAFWLMLSFTFYEFGFPEAVLLRLYLAAGTFIGLVVGITFLIEGRR